MPIRCAVILRWGATPAQLTAVGTALWDWCRRAAGNSGVYQYLDNQALADLIAGQFPASGGRPGQAGPPAVHFSVKDEAFVDRQAAIDSLRRDLPAAGVEGVAVEGARWGPADSLEKTRPTAQGLNGAGRALPCETTADSSGP
jgi:hypothetical protein